MSDSWLEKNHRKSPLPNIDAIITLVRNFREEYTTIF